MTTSGVTLAVHQPSFQFEYLTTQFVEE